MSTPFDFGYTRCARCGTWRPKGGLVFNGDAPPVCVEVAFCSTTAGVGLGKLDVEGAKP